MPITSDDLCQFTQAIWESTLGLAVQPVERLSASQERACKLIGKVQIVGPRQHAVSLECTPELAGKIACAMFGLDLEKPTPDEIRDALAEITNVTAGNIKSLGCIHCQLSTPEVTQRAQDSPEATDSAVLSRQAFVCQGEPFVVSLLQA